jgi:hypothetical protein
MPASLSHRLVTAATFAALAASPVAAQSLRHDVAPIGTTTLRPFASDRELSGYLRRILEERERRWSRRARLGSANDAAGAPQAAAEMSVAQGITNNQTAGVDEGGIIKLANGHLVMLRRGRLFTVRVGGGALVPVTTTDAFGPGINPGGTWYDELLVAGDKVIVIGYSYERGGTEVGVFRMAPEGTISYLATYQLTSNDYYSSRNYASRLIGTRLVFYTPLYLGSESDPLNALPQFRRWRDSADARFRRIAPAARVYRAAGPLPIDDATLHTVTTCELDAPVMSCQATVVVGPSSRVFYVSGNAVYVWMASWRWGWDGSGSDSEDRAMEYRGAQVVRMPLDGSAPSSVRAAGVPVDQFSFLESADGHLNVLVRAEGNGDAMWSGTRTDGSAALIRIPLAAFGDGSQRVPHSAYRPVPAPAGYEFQNRFVGNYLLYGTGAGWDTPRGDSATLTLVPWRGGSITQLTLPHGVDRIEVMGHDAVVVGTFTTDLHFTGIRLGRTPRIAQRYVLANAAQGETRSHGFFYRRDNAADGIIGLPVRGGGDAGWRHLVEGSAAVVYLRNTGTGFEPLGRLAAGADRRTNDACRASCVDWYGNARPVFIGSRVFALMGYEIVEGVERDGRIEELRRVNYGPWSVAAR